MDNLDAIRAGMQRLIPDTCEVLGPVKINKVIEFCAAGANLEDIGSAFVAPEFGHPSSFADHLQIASECAGLIVAGIKIIETLTMLAIKGRKTQGSDLETDQAKLAKKMLDDRTRDNIEKYVDVVGQIGDEREKDR